jgi:hypothetical protein
MHISLWKYIVPTVHLLNISATRIEPMYRCKILNFKNNASYNICIKNQNTYKNYYFLVPVWMRCDRRWNIVTYLETSNSLPYRSSGLANLWHALPKWPAAFDTVPPPPLLISSAWPGSLYCDEYVCVCVYAYVYVCVYIYIYTHMHISDW